MTIEIRQGLFLLLTILHDYKPSAFKKIVVVLLINSHSDTEGTVERFELSHRDTCQQTVFSL